MGFALWEPSQKTIDCANMTRFRHYVNEKRHLDLQTYDQLYAWSVERFTDFWETFWDFSGIKSLTEGEIKYIAAPKFQDCKFFPYAKLNYADNLLRHQGHDPAVIFWGEDKVKRQISWDEMRNSVQVIQGSLKNCDVKKGDRIAAFLPNLPETLIAMLATTSLGAVWSSCSPDFGVSATIDRFQQIDPKVLFVVDGYLYNGKQINCLEKVAEIVKELPTVEKVIVIPYLGLKYRFEDHRVIGWEAFCESSANSDLTFEYVEFDHPLFIMFSSGTTGKPKCIVHGHGGTLIQHMKEHLLHCDLKIGDRLFYFTTCGWMMWNWQVSALACGVTLVLYDGAPFAGRDDILFDYIDEAKINVFGTSAKYIDTLRKREIYPRSTHDLSSLRMITATGSPLAEESYHYVYENIKRDLCLSSISGGTDIISCFALGNPIAPVRPEELQTRGLGMAVEVYTFEGESVIDRKGELVCTKPFPSKPIQFWNDPLGEKYSKTYFEKFKNVWHHGDYAKITKNGGMIIYGRSDATLNPGGVRIGTAEIYAQVEKIPYIEESVAVGQEWDHDVRVVLFVKTKEKKNLSPEMVQEIKDVIREGASPRHVPAKIIQVCDIPKTVNGKISELAVYAAVHHKEIGNMEALANPNSLMHFKGLRELTS